jgi:hypothetical protein
MPQISKQKQRYKKTAVSKSDCMAELIRRFCVDKNNNKINLQILQHNKVFIKGRAIAQAVSRRLPTAAARVQTRVWSFGIL